MTMFVKKKSTNERSADIRHYGFARRGNRKMPPPLTQKGISVHFGGNFATFNIQTTPHPNITGSQNLFWAVFYR